MLIKVLDPQDGFVPHPSKQFTVL